MISIIKRVFKIRRQKVFFLTNPNDINAVTAKKKINLIDVTFDNVDFVKVLRSEAQVKVFYSFLEEGQYGVYAKLNDKVIGYAWAKVCRKDFCRVNSYMDISKDEALIHYCNVSKYYRGNNIYPAMLVTLCHRLFYEAKVKRIIIDTEMNNHSSLRGIAKVGFKLLGMGIYFQFRRRLLFKHFKYFHRNLSILEGRFTVNG